MKVPSNNSTLNNPSQAKANARRSESQNRAAATRASDEAANIETHAGEASERSFAAVLDELTARPAKDTHDEKINDDNAHDNHTTNQTRAEREDKTKREDERKDSRDDGNSRGGFERQANNTVNAPREPVAREAALNLRAILHIADLERIVAAVRTQTLDGRREVTISLQRSVLEGLQVKLSADGAGRISAEFITATEAMRAQLDARTTDLAALMRSRNIDLAALKTSVGGNASDSNRDGDHSAPRDLAHATQSLTNNSPQAISSIEPDTSHDANAIGTRETKRTSDTNYRA